MRTAVLLPLALPLVLASALASPAALAAPAPPKAKPSAPVPSVRANAFPVQEGFVDANGVFVYYKSLGHGEPLLVLHGGPGASHDYLLPGILPLARTNRLILIDERGSGRSQRLEDHSQYTLEKMADDAEAVRVALGLGKIHLMGHSCGGNIALVYALKYQQNLRSLHLASTFHSTRKMNEVFVKMKERMAPELRARIEKMEAEGLFGHGKEWEKGRYTAEYMSAAWGEGYLPYIMVNHLDPNYDPAAGGNMGWDVYREMWGSDGEFVISGNLKGFEVADRISSIHVPTLITAGDRDECDPSISREMHASIAGSTLVILPKSGHLTFVDQPELFAKAVSGFLKGVPR